MLIQIYSLSEEAVENRDYRSALKIEVNNKNTFEVYDGEPEDNSLGRNFSACWDIEKLMKMAYEAGESGEEYTVEYFEVDEL